VKKIEAIIRPEKANAVINALLAAGDAGVTVYEVAGHGKQRSSGERAQGHEIQLRPKVMLVTIVKDSEAAAMAKVILDAAKTDVVGDGKIFITDLSDMIRIRDSKHGEGAIE
jgi:nitrogen regulatory protein P-II 1